MSPRTNVPRTAAACLLLLAAVSGGTASASDLRLVTAAANRDTPAIRALLQQHVDVNTPEPDGATALHWAVHWDDREAADLLIRAGARVDAANDLGITPLSLACTNGNAPMVQALLSAGANPNLALSGGETPLMTASRTGNPDVVRALLARGAVVDAREAFRGQTALMWAISERHPDAAQILIEHGADVHARSTSGFTPLMFAAREGDLRATRMVLAAGAKPNETGSDGTSPLLVATVRGHADVAVFLLDQGADPNAETAGYTALHWAAGSWDTTLTGVFGVDEGFIGGLQGQAKLDLVKALLAHGANPNARVIKSPPRFGFSVSAPRLPGATPFWLAAMAGDLTVMRVLLAGGADPTLVTKDRTTVLMAASGLYWTEGESRVTEPRALDAVKLALELGGEVNAANDAGETALHAASYMGADSIVRVLVEHGARLTARNRQGYTPLTIAEGVNHAGAVIVHHSTAELLRKLAAEQHQ